MKSCPRPVFFLLYFSSYWICLCSLVTLNCDLAKWDGQSEGIFQTQTSCWTKCQLTGDSAVMAYIKVTSTLYMIIFVILFEFWLKTQQRTNECIQPFVVVVVPLSHLVLFPGLQQFCKGTWVCSLSKRAGKNKLTAKNKWNTESAKKWASYFSVTVEWQI